MVDVPLPDLVRPVSSAGQLRLAQVLLFAIFLVCGCSGAVVALVIVSQTLRRRPRSQHLPALSRIGLGLLGIRGPSLAAAASQLEKGGISRSCGLLVGFTSALGLGLTMDDYLLGPITVFGAPLQNLILLALAIVLAGMAVAAWRSGRD